VNIYNDNAPKVCAWASELVKAGHVAPGTVLCKSIKEVQADELRQANQVHLFAGILGWPLALQLAGWGDRPVWTGSCPCQPFSAAGKRKGTADERHLWPDMLRLIAECKPECIFGEQVSSYQAVAWWDQVASDLEAIGYTCWANRLDARCFGYEHERQRLYWCANTIGIGQPEPWQHWQDPICQQAQADREADRFVDAVRRKAMPFLCPGANGVRPRVGEVCIHGAGNAVIPQVAAAFVRAFMETEAA
jgi:DNA (cytosine-5)-methyltransferase 1